MLGIPADCAVGETVSQVISEPGISLWLRGCRSTLKLSVSCGEGGSVLVGVWLGKASLRM